MQQLITGSRVIADPGETHLDHGAVLVEGGTVRAVGRVAEVERIAAPDAVRRDHPGATIMPGLINAHVHLAFDNTAAELIGALHNTDDHDLLLGMATRAQQLLSAGVTTARDLGDRDGLAVRLRDAIGRGEMTGPRILAAGAPLTIPGGHCWFLGGEVEGDEAIRAQVRHNAARGVDVIKVMLSGGQMTPGGASMWESQFTTDQVRSIVAEAREVGLPVAAHAHGTESIASAVEAGVQTVEHCTFLGADGVPDLRDDIAERMASEGVVACSAASAAWREFFERIGPERAERNRYRKRWLRERGVRMIVGTDSGLPTSAFNDFAGALELYQHLGFPPAQVLRMATVDSARALGLGEQVGRLAPGCSADLLVCEGDPVSDLLAVRHVQRVISRGRAYVPSELPQPSR